MLRISCSEIYSEATLKAICQKEEGLFVRTELSINSKTLLQSVHAQKKKEVGGSGKK